MPETKTVGPYVTPTELSDVSESVNNHENRLANIEERLVVLESGDDGAPILPIPAPNPIPPIPPADGWKQILSIDPGNYNDLDGLMQDVEHMIPGSNVFHQDQHFIGNGQVVIEDGWVKFTCNGNIDSFKSAVFMKRLGISAVNGWVVSQNLLIPDDTFNRKWINGGKGNPKILDVEDGHGGGMRIGCAGNNPGTPIRINNKSIGTGIATNSNFLPGAHHIIQCEYKPDTFIVRLDGNIILETQAKFFTGSDPLNWTWGLTITDLIAEIWFGPMTIKIAV